MLDLFCGGGGAAQGYYDAGFDVVGVDKAAQPHYPFPMCRGDVFEVLDRLLRTMKPAAVHASPPCQKFVTMADRDRHPDLIEPTRQVLRSLSIPFVMENVELAPLEYPTMLCGTTFGLGVQAHGEFYELQRHRYFESNLALMNNGACRHSGGRVAPVYGNPGGFDRRRNVRLLQVAHWREAMGIGWLPAVQLREAIPPAYTRHLGAQILAELDVRRGELAVNYT
jgi:DNA (cytosine-5)-methyltransferase 1